MLWAHAIGFVLVGAWAVTAASSPAAPDLVAGAIAGVFGMIGLVFLYTGLAQGRAAVVAPSAAVVGALIPVVAGVISGERPALLSWVGVAVALPAIVLVSSIDGLDRRSAGLGHGLAAGTFFGFYFVALAATSEGSELWPLIASRGASTIILSAAALVVRKGWQRLPRGRAGWAVLGVGVFDLGGNVIYLLATRAGPLVVVAVVASLYPAVTVIASRFVYDEHLSVGQIVGLVGALGAVVLLAAA